MIPPRTTFHPIDAYVGKRLRFRRKMQSMSQTKLGDAVGLTFQQIQKYERGANRIGASRLFEFSQILEVPVSYFFDDMPDEIKETGGARQALDENIESAMLDPMLEPDSVALVRAYGKITDASVRKSMFNLAKILGKSDDK